MFGIDNLFTIVTPTVALISLIFTAFVYFNNSFKDISQGYQQILNEIYLGFLEIYSTNFNSKEVKVKEFFNSIYRSNINTETVKNYV